MFEKIEKHISLCLPPPTPPPVQLPQFSCRKPQFTPHIPLVCPPLLSLDAVIVAGLLALTLLFTFAYRLRREGRSNGTAILRRSSTTPFTNNQLVPNASSHSASIDASHAAMDESNDRLPPQSSATFPHPDSTYSKYSREELLGISHADLPPVHELLREDFRPDGHVNGNSSRGWGKTNDANVHNDPTICWAGERTWTPLGLQALSDEEKEVGPATLPNSSVSSFCPSSFIIVSSPYSCGMANHRRPVSFIALFLRCQLPPEANSTEPAEQGRRPRSCPQRAKAVSVARHGFTLRCL